MSLELKMLILAFVYMTLGYYIRVAVEVFQEMDRQANDRPSFLEEDYDDDYWD